MIELFKLNHSLSFPSLEFALDEPNGLLAYGGDLSPERLVAAYKNGIFPWFSENEPLLWWSPNPRAIIDARDFHANKSLRKSIRKQGFYASLNQDFNSVIEHCSKVVRHNLNDDDVNNDDLDNDDLSPPSTWITADMMQAYKHLHQLGFAHSIEIYNQKHELVGGLYGVVVSGIFCGESMFHLQTDASKAGFLALSQHMCNNNMWLIDCQLVNPHLERLGCEAIERDEFVNLLRQNQQWVDCWHAKKLPPLL